ncbi:hypothetical protein A2526_06450 [candidate division WOR-1 bacterium RIFOXYD2_FULL_36_8]|uniref:Flagellar assembly protein FliH/Type III secretion system HrpE domain-containing protein n=1 Tax=candidate division WOR-1 bacterium RIFOXYB2_FULL_36_35 TaxID=1802578 RepID=A0A1F4S7A4_UNCSA|nr:MAG: hypothetical protein A2230_01655 [candidate division WOR-1 bacterium RIFOXYA2_FULL_36_21]OGC15686.1 MAG: hypothetical protein A2282_04390 [candidate division WOR-1 bacterium RIFOXYA12_FULL_36_13]OGC16316.1 MAG: hypothetical protein A2290_04380 [candidate division WOR-1 bacterium RIFOXYB2_FULL_36_35]OGC41738.1 MAG: hypothetical protein A2526_06450 [candidate division WOR-1 bacterium RIFOXYD2_FULL_36_8]
MGLIKRLNITQTGEILLEKKPIRISKDLPLDFGWGQDLRQEENTTFKEEEEISEEQSFPDVISDEEKLSEADKQARGIIEEAKLEAKKIREDSQKRGREEGKKEATEKIKDALSTLNQAVKERKEIIKDAESEILRLALKAAEQIIHSEVSLHRDVCLNVVSDAINRVSDREQIIIKVNREDADYIKRYKDRLSGLVDGVKSLSILEDSQIEPGGCIIETNLGYVDARISTKIEVLGEALKRASEEVEAV